MTARARLRAGPLSAFDLLLVPAYAAAALIERGALLPLPGPAGRAHDPEGAFTLPYARMAAALLYRGGPPPAGLDDLWRHPAQTLWPDDARLVIGAALLRRGYSPNDTHPGRLALAQADLAEMRPRLAADPAAALRAGRGRLAYALLDVSQLQAGGPFVPLDGGPLVEYDWVIPAGAQDPAAARHFLQALPLAGPALRAKRAQPGRRLIPLTPLPADARAQHAEIWRAVSGRDLARQPQSY